MESVATFCRETFSPFSEIWLFKTVSSVGVASVAYFFGADLWYASGAVTFLVAIDSITAIWASWKGGEVIKPSMAMQVIPKFIRYGLFLASAHLVQTLVGVDIYIEDAVVIFLGITEFISIAGNLERLGMKLPKVLMRKVKQIQDGQ